MSCAEKMEIICEIREWIGQLPNPILAAVTGASILALFPFIALSLKRYAYDIEKYGVLFPYLWMIIAVGLTILTCVNDNSIIPRDKASPIWLKFGTFFGITTCVSIVMYSGFFLFFCLAEVISHRFGWYLLTWMVTFLTIILCIILAGSFGEIPKWARWEWNDDTAYQNEKTCVSAFNEDPDWAKCKSSVDEFD